MYNNNKSMFHINEDNGNTIELQINIDADNGMQYN